MNINEIARKPSADFTYVMTDIETMGTFSGCRVLSIGAVQFDLTGIIPNTDFYVEISARSSFHAGLWDDHETAAWWDKQPIEATRMLRRLEDGGGVALAKALQLYEAWLPRKSPDSKVELFANDPDFDYVILAHAYRACGWDRQPWDFRAHRSMRTLRALRPNIDVKTDGVRHNALDDAKSQALRASAILRDILK